MIVRQPIVTVLGHVDHGKTKFLDMVRGTTITEAEAGAITQHIGATEVPLRVVEKIAGDLLKKFGFKVESDGLLFIDTPGHEAFTNLRKRGGSIADIAVLVIDINQGVQPQTEEAIEILKSFKVPFIVAANKIDMLQGYYSKEGEFSKNIQEQSDKAEQLLDEKIYVLVGKLFEKGFNAERFDRCNDFTKQVAIVPTSAKTGEGIPEALVLLSGLSQKFLKDRLTIDEHKAGKGTILEVKEERGLGKTVDIILYEGMLEINEPIVLGGKHEIIETKIRALLKPKPLQEIRQTTEKFNYVKQVNAACGVKIAAPNLGDALPGAPLMGVKKGNEKEIIEKEIAEVKVETSADGVVLKADTLGALEALVMLLEKQGLKPKHADVGDVTRRDIMDALSAKEKKPLEAIIFAFNVGIEGAAEEEAKKRGIKIFSGNVIYKIVEDYEKWIKEIKETERKKVLDKVVLPVKIEFLKGFVFRNTDPAIFGVKVLDGTLRAGPELINKQGKIIGRVEAVQDKNESLKEAKKGKEVAVSVQGATIGRNVKPGETLFSYIPKSSEEKYEKLKDFLKEDDFELIQEIFKIQKQKEAVA
ncbi:MAG: translation initiation factor IF-2 [Candidatus Diapherotrites archaeon]|nr:translation initiation factor IF-2 [Candidatus Diapherotrites archaeon]